MIEPSPLDTDTAIWRIHGLRRANQIALRTVHLNEESIERQLARMDDETAGITAQELRSIRAQLGFS